MSFCYLDPVFLAINESFTFKHFKNTIYLNLSEFVERIDELEELLRYRIVYFNITQELIYSATSFNPFQYHESDSAKLFFERFILEFLIKRRNVTCESRELEEDESTFITYINDNVPVEIMKIWNEFLNKCNTCIRCEKNYLDLLSIENYNSIGDSDSDVFFTDIYLNMLNWIEERIDLENIPVNPPIVEIDPKLKRKPRWKHSHSKKIVKEINKLLVCEYIRFIEPVGKTRKINKDLVKIKDYSELEIYLSEGNGSEIFIATITARDLREANFIIERIIAINPNFEIMNTQ